jgi:transposase
MKVILEGLGKGRRERGAAGKTPVFGILKHGGKIYTVVIKDSNNKE